MPFPKLIHYSKRCLEILDLDLAEPTRVGSKFVKYLAGNDILPGNIHFGERSELILGRIVTLATNSACSSFFAGRLGDGRAMSLAEIVNSKGERWELQLKGSGETPYSRMGGWVGRIKVLSNAALGIPTTRALSLIHTAQLVHREEVEEGAVVGRLAPSWLRFGSFELFRMTGDVESLQTLADYALRHHSLTF
ncbi:hypothetical protein L0F63_005703 [Massospora cicadina]|nr:hypothetical protein L0F63_005703 [Massospora cicadina]